MKISIVVPVYNAEKYLIECIESVLNQTSDNWELILVDDGSTDKSGEICDSFSKQYPERIFSFHKSNEGQFLTRKYGIKKCTGEYIGFLDADDFLDEKFVDVINSTVAEDFLTDIVCFNFARFYKNGFTECLELKKEDFNTVSEIKRLHEKIVTGEITGALWSKVFKSDLLLNVKLNEDTVSNKRFAEDAFHSFSVMFNAKNVKFVEDVLYYYRDNPLGASFGYDERDLDYFNTKYVFYVIEKFLSERYPDDEYLFEKLYAHNFNNAVNHILKYYRNANSKERKKEIIQYDWGSYLLDKTSGFIENNKYVRQSYKKVWKAFCKKKYTEIYIREKFIGW